MARQNIDEKWKTDPRRNALAERLGSARLADGMRVEINWLLLDHRGQGVPMKVFKFIKDWEHWIECGLAEVRGDNVHISGADAYKEFFEKQRENASKGGKAKAAQTKPKLPKAAQTRPECPSFSSSFSSSISENTREREARAPTGPQINSLEALKAAIPIITAEAWARRYPDPGWIESQIEAAFIHHTAVPGERPQLTGQWMKKLNTWFEIGWGKRAREVGSGSPIDWTKFEDNSGGAA